MAREALCFESFTCIKQPGQPDQSILLIFQSCKLKLELNFKNYEIYICKIHVYRKKSY